MTQLPTPQNTFVTVTVAGQLFGIPVMQVQDILAPQDVTPVPLTLPEVAGLVNLRGRVVTAIDLRVRLGLPRLPAERRSMSIVVEHEGDLYSLLIDEPGEVLSLPIADCEESPVTLDPRWRDFTHGIYRLTDALLVVLDIDSLLCVGERAAA